MTIVVNGERREIADGASITDLIRLLKLDKAACAVEVNKRLVPKARHAEQALAPEDRVEVVTLVGGG